MANLIEGGCAYVKPWSGACNKPIDSNDRCLEHSKTICVSCGALATHGCDETMTQFVCGYDLCDDCEHTICDNGCNSGGKLPEGMQGHCRKGQQVYNPWYMVDGKDYIKVQHPPKKEKGAGDDYPVIVYK